MPTYAPTVWVNGTTAIEFALLNKMEQAIDVLHDALLLHLLPTGAIVAYGGSDTPSGWLLCDGSLVSTGGANAALFAIMGHAYNGGSDPGGGQFKLPDHRDRQVYGASATRIRGSTGGTRPHGHAITGTGSHSHSGSIGASGSTVGRGLVPPSPPSSFSSPGSHGHSISGSGGAHDHALSGTVDTARVGVRWLVKT